MSLLLEVARIAAVGNVALLLTLGYVWGLNWRAYRASHTLGLLIFAAFLLVQNGVWLYLYLIHETFIGWFRAGDLAYQVSMTLLCALQTVALIALARITWR